LSFVEVRLPDWAENISGGGPEFVTFRTTVRSGAESAVGVWNYPKHTWTLDSRAITEARYEDLLSFFINRAGSLHGFRFKDPRDYLIGRTYNILTGVTTEAPVSTSQLTTTTFQIQRPYTHGGSTVNVPVYKINGTTLTNTVADETNSTVRVYLANGTTEVTSGWTVNLTTGVITYSVAPGYVPKVSCEFDFPVRFDIDSLPTSYLGFIRNANAVRLKQITQL
jgi:uncharacterized protein (TIGR02217 family)